MDIDTAYYGRLTTDRQKRRFYRVKKAEALIFVAWKHGWFKTYNVLNHRIVIPFGKWYIR